MSAGLEDEVLKGKYGPDGLLFRFEGRYIGQTTLPREIYGVYPFGFSRFWASYLSVGDLFIWQGGNYRVVVNSMENISDLIQKYVFYAVPAPEILREE